jgi:hypothetical protein
MVLLVAVAEPLPVQPFLQAYLQAKAVFEIFGLQVVVVQAVALPGVTVLELVVLESVKS